MRPFFLGSTLTVHLYTHFTVLCTHQKTGFKFSGIYFFNLGICIDRGWAGRGGVDRNWFRELLRSWINRPKLYINRDLDFWRDESLESSGWAGLGEKRLNQAWVGFSSLSSHVGGRVETKSSPLHLDLSIYLGVYLSIYSVNYSWSGAQTGYRGFLQHPR